MIYYDERVIEGSVATDSGAETRDGIKSVATTGVCPESEWAYDISKFAIARPAACYTDAKKFEALAYLRVSQSAYDVRQCLASGRPVLFGQRRRV